MFVTIVDAADPRLGDFRLLNDARHRRRLEAPGPFGGGMFVVEGWLALDAALDTRASIRAVLVAAPRRDRLADLLARHGAAPTVYVASAEVVASVVGFDLHRGVVAAVDRRRPPEPATVAARASRLVVVEGVNDGENLGALFRTAAGLGADGVLVDPTAHDPLSRRSIRVSLGHVLRVPWARVAEPWRLPDHRVLALTPGPGATPLDEVAFVDGERLAIVVGAEGPGLSDDALAAADERVAIPMAAGVDSLNVATATAIALWHLRR